MTREGAALSPADVLEELRRELRDALDRTGWTQAALGDFAGLKRTTVNQALSSKVDKSPSRRTVTRLIKALKLQDKKDHLLGLHTAAEAPSSRNPTAEAPAPLGLPIAELDDAYALEHLEVHRSIDPGPPTLSRLTPYIHRGHDVWLAGIAREAQTSSRMAVLIGDSSTGKTRALHALLLLNQFAEWRLWQPYDSEGFLTAYNRGEIGPRTVLWMNESQRYLDGPRGEETARALLGLLADQAVGPVLVLGSLWRENHATLTVRPERNGPDPHAQARRLLDGRCREVPGTFDDDDMAELARLAQQDRRLTLAMECGGRQIPQFLAGAQELVRRFETAPTGAKAVIRAAIDARRLGHGLLIGDAFLRAAAPGYLTDQQWQLLGEKWFEEALRYAGKECKGVPGPLTPHRPRPGEATPSAPVYRLADYLEQYGRDTFRHDVPPAGFWAAAERAVTDPSDLLALAGSGKARLLLRQSAGLYRAAAEAGRPRGWLRLGELHEQAGDSEGAARFFRTAADCGEFHGHLALAHVRRKAGDSSAALRLCQTAARIAATAANPSEADLLVVSLADPLANAGDSEGAEELCRALIALGGDHQWLWFYAASLRLRAGDREGAEPYAREAARRGDDSALLSLVDAWRSAGDEARADRLYDEVIDLSTPLSLGELALSLEKENPPEAERLFRIIDEREGDSAAALWIRAVRLLEAGDRTGAERLFRASVDAGDPAGLYNLGSLCLDAEDWDGAEQYALRDIAETGGSLLLNDLDLTYRDTGRTDRLRTLFEQLMEAGHTDAAARLARLLDEAGEHAEADRLVFRAVAAGDSAALRMLNRPDDPRHRRMLQYGLEPDGSIADPWW
ncbi:tetratricopeptide repeat protein [Streptomyces sp. NPDC046727]|uniref:tetratricopeptide repeat protein n=1 Tax=Streptomyces sp. NPDC046727 TaxID=3155373 RepID=UPI0033FEDE6C